MSLINVATWNVRGVQSKDFRERKIKYLFDTNYDFLFTQELRLNTTSDVDDVCKMWH